MNFSFLVAGLFIGFSIGAPVGPIGALCIRRSVADGWRVGLAAGLGAATADALYGCVAGFGLASVADFVTGHEYWLGLLGGAVLCFLGVRTLLAAPPAVTAEHERGGTLSAFASTLLLTLANPAILLAFFALFAAFGLDASDTWWHASAMVLGVFIGSASWWVVLNGGLGLFGARLNAAWIRVVNRLAGSAILTFGMYAVSRSLWR